MRIVADTSNFADCSTVADQQFRLGRGDALPKLYQRRRPALRSRTLSNMSFKYTSML